MARITAAKICNELTYHEPFEAQRVNVKRSGILSEITCWMNAVVKLQARMHTHAYQHSCPQKNGDKKIAQRSNSIMCDAIKIVQTISLIACKPQMVLSDFMTNEYNCKLSRRVFQAFSVLFVAWHRQNILF